MELTNIIDTFGTYQHPQAQFLLVLEWVNDNNENFRRRHATNIIKKSSKVNMILKLRHKNIKQESILALK